MEKCESDDVANLIVKLADTLDALLYVNREIKFNEVKDEWFVDDGVHYTSVGSEYYLNFIKNSLPKDFISGEICGKTAREKYWSALSSYFGPIGAAGIMGNIASEGGFNPVMIESCGGVLRNPYNFAEKKWSELWGWDNYYNHDSINVPVDWRWIFCDNGASCGLFTFYQ